MALSAVTQSQVTMTTLRGLLDQVLRIQHGSVHANACLAPAQVQTPGTYDCLELKIPADTRVESAVEVEHDAQGRRCLVGWVHFSQPVRIKNGINAFTAPSGVWRWVRPLANWATGYALTGVTFGTDRPTLLQGEASLLGVHMGYLDRRINAAVANAPRATLESQSLRLGLQAVTNLGQASTGPGNFFLQAYGLLPANVPVSLSEQSFALVPGGPYQLQATGSFDLRQAGSVHLQVEAPQHQSTFQSAALNFALRARATLGLEDNVNRRLHMRTAGQLHLAVDHLALDVRDKDMADSGGIRVVGGSIRSKTPPRPALVAPVNFAYQRGALATSGLLKLDVGATFVDPCAQPAPFEDDHEACDVKGTLDLSALVPHLGRPPLPLQRRAPPDYAIRGVISVRPPSSDPVYYRMQVTPLGPDFELEPDYKPAEAVLASRARS